jgi:hypothetical protein
VWRFASSEMKVVAIMLMVQQILYLKSKVTQRSCNEKYGNLRELMIKWDSYVE